MQILDPALDPTVDPTSMTEENWKSILSPLEFQILRHAATERPETGPYLDNESAGSYHCVGCAARLYDATHKFHSGCGWPSFFQEIEANAITTHRDESLFRARTEMRCARCDGHLGHIFDDAPHQPTGKRHCVNGTILVFVPAGADVVEVFRNHRGH